MQLRAGHRHLGARPKPQQPSGRLALRRKCAAGHGRGDQPQDDGADKPPPRARGPNRGRSHAPKLLHSPVVAAASSWTSCDSDLLCRRVPLTRVVGVLVTCVCACAVSGTLAANPAVAAGTIGADVSGPSNADYNTVVGFTLTITNTGDATAHNVAFSIGFPDNPPLESNEDVSCSVSTAGDGAGHLVGTIGDLAAGASVACTFNVRINGAGALHHPWTVTSSDAGTVSGEYDLTGNPLPPPPPPPPPTTITFSFSDPVKTHGLTGTQVATVVNTGSNPALALHVRVVAVGLLRHHHHRRVTQRRYVRLSEPPGHQL